MEKIGIRTNNKRIRQPQNIRTLRIRNTVEKYKYSDPYPL